jgi:hypothetical protein
MYRLAAGPGAQQLREVCFVDLAPVGNSLVPGEFASVSHAKVRQLLTLAVLQAACALCWKTPLVSAYC